MTCMAVTTNAADCRAPDAAALLNADRVAMGLQAFKFFPALTGRTRAIDSVERRAYGKQLNRKLEKW